MDIPYTVAERPDTGLNNGKIGIWLFLASEVMLFGALFASYLMMRIGAPTGTWPRGDSILNVPLATLNTVVLISSSVTMVMVQSEMSTQRTWMWPRRGISSVSVAPSSIAVFDPGSAPTSSSPDGARR